MLQDNSLLLIPLRRELNDALLEVVIITKLTFEFGIQMIILEMDRGWEIFECSAIKVFS